MKFKILIILLFFVACKSKKVTTDIQRENTTENTREIQRITDTIYKERVVIKTRPVYSETIIESPCDSLGRIRPLNTSIGSGANRSSLSTLNGQIILRQYIDSTSQQSELIKRLRIENDSLIAVHSTFKENTLSVKEKIFVWPWWIYALIIGSIVFAGLWIYTKFFTPL